MLLQLLLQHAMFAAPGPGRGKPFDSHSEARESSGSTCMNLFFGGVGCFKMF